MAQALADSMRCSLSGKIMSDPVIIVKQTNNTLLLGCSFERNAVEKWMNENRDMETRFVSNPSLKETIGFIRLKALGMS